MSNPKRELAILQARRAACATGKAHCGYVSGNEFKTFTGVKLGDVVSQTRFRRSPIQGMTSYRIRGTNGAMYHGRHGDMDFLRVRKVKSK